MFKSTPVTVIKLVSVKEGFEVVLVRADNTGKLLWANTEELTPRVRLPEWL